MSNINQTLHKVAENEIGLMHGHEGGGDDEDAPAHQAEVIRRLNQIRQSTVVKKQEVNDNMREVSHNPGEFICMFLINLLLFIVLPVYLMSCWVILSPNEAVILSSFGKVRKVVKRPGCHYNPLLEKQSISTKVETLSIKGSSVPDLKGSPMNVSVIVNFKIVDPIKSVYAVDDYKGYIYNQSLEVLRTVCSRFAYRSSNSEPCLMTDSTLIGHYMAGLLQDRTEICGVQILKMEIMEVAYHAEVAQSLLLVQQAQAKVDARKLIVKGSVEIVNGALENLREKGINMTKESEHDLVRRLMIITCSDAGNA